MSLALPLTVPRVLTDAVAVCANPGAYADRPTLLHLARQVLASAAADTAPRADTAGGRA